MRARVAAGVCGSCGAHPLATRWKCGGCRDRHNESRRLAADLRKGVGLCGGCNRPAVAGKRTCALCTAEQRERAAGGHNEYRRTLYQSRAAAGVCVRCGVNPPEGGRRRCVGCGKVERKKAKRRRARKRLLGLCVGCGVRKAQPGRTRCRRCLDAINNYSLERYREKKREREQSSGVAGAHPRGGADGADRV